MEQHSEKYTKTFRKIEGLRNLSSIPKILIEVNQLIKAEPGNMIKLARLIGKDQGLTTKILAVANSPLYGLQRKVSSLEFALMVMGTEEISRIVTAITLSDSLRFQSRENFKYIDYWKHSMLVGTAAKDMSIRLGFSDLCGEAFLAGILHDVGIQVIAQYFEKEYEEILEMVKEGSKFYNAEKEVLGVGHDAISVFLSQKWKLPESLTDAIQFHHHPSESVNNKALASIVHLADSMTQEFKVGDCIWDKKLSFDGNVVEILKFESAEIMSHFVSEYNEVFIDTAENIVL